MYYSQKRIQPNRSEVYREYTTRRQSAANRLSLSGLRAANGLGSAPSQEKRSKVVAGSSPVLAVGNLD